jgi:hypothetical protein
MSDLAREIQNLREGDQEGANQLVRQAIRHRDHDLTRQAMMKAGRGWKRRWASYILYQEIKRVPEGKWVWVGRVHDRWGLRVSRSHFVDCAKKLLGVQVGKGRPLCRKEVGVRGTPSLPYLVDDLLFSIERGRQYASGWGMFGYTINELAHEARRLAPPPMTIRDLLNQHTDFDWKSAMDRWPLIVAPSTESRCFGFVDVAVAEAVILGETSLPMRYNVDFPESNQFLYVLREAAEALAKIDLGVDVVAKVEEYIYDLSFYLNPVSTEEDL